MADKGSSANEHMMSEDQSSRKHYDVKSKRPHSSSGASDIS